jgi:CheY-like chemotaxis protein
MQSEQRLRQAQKMEAVGRLAGGIAHDFNNLLTLIHSYSEMAIADLEGQDAIRADVEQIKLAAQRAAALTRQLLAFSRRQVLLPREIALNDIIVSFQKMLLRVIGADVTLEVDLDPDLVTVFADPGQIEQVLMNLVLNSRNAMPGGGRISIASRNVTLRDPSQSPWTEATAGQYAELTVTDTGSGIPADALPFIFEPFFSTRDRGSGTGLGLSTVYGIVSQSGGFVRVESREGQGTTMRVILPVHRVAVEADVPATPAPVAAKKGNETVLLAEDDQAVRALARRVLEAAGYSVLEAENGEDALALFGRNTDRVDLVVTDIVMPRMNGRAFVRELLKRNAAPRVLFMSGYTENEIVRQDLLPAGTVFMEKPFTMQSLLLSVRRALA